MMTAFISALLCSAVSLGAERAALVCEERSHVLPVPVPRDVVENASDAEQDEADGTKPVSEDECGHRGEQRERGRLPYSAHLRLAEAPFCEGEERSRED